MRHESHRSPSAVAKLPTHHDLTTRFADSPNSPDIVDTLAPYPDYAPCHFKCRFRTHSEHSPQTAPTIQTILPGLPWRGWASGKPMVGARSSWRGGLHVT